MLLISQKKSVKAVANSTALTEKAAVAAAATASLAENKAAFLRAGITPEPTPVGAGDVNATEEVKEKPRIEMTTETDVDRIIDSQDNEYVLSRPK